MNTQFTPHPYAASVQIIQTTGTNWDGRPIRQIMTLSADIDTDAAGDRPYSAIRFKSKWNSQEIDYYWCIQSHEHDNLARWTNEADAIRTFGEDTIKKAHRELEKLRKEISRQRNAGRKHPAYPAMLEIAKEKVTRYKSDFYYHDLRALAQHPGAPFIWIVKESGCGTWMLKDHTDSFTQQTVKYSTAPKNGSHTLYIYTPAGGLRKTRSQTDANAILAELKAAEDRQK